MHGQAASLPLNWIEPASPAWASSFFTTKSPGKPLFIDKHIISEIFILQRDYDLNPCLPNSCNKYPKQSSSFLIYRLVDRDHNKTEGSSSLDLNAFFLS